MQNSTKFKCECDGECLVLLGEADAQTRLYSDELLSLVTDSVAELGEAVNELQQGALKELCVCVCV